MDVSRRHLIATMASTGSIGLVGCLGDDEQTLGGDGDGVLTETPEEQADTVTETRLFEPDEFTCATPPSVDPFEGPPPTSQRSLPLPACPDELYDASRRGAGKDAIPSIEDPVYEHADQVGGRLAGGDIVFGFEHDGDAFAYPQNILVYHEIVNDTFGSEQLSITYCPLTGTAQGFVRGDTTFGVSGLLINSNLVMYDRETDSYIPQILATGITGTLLGATLEEFNVVWTTWERWREVYPDTVVLTEETGYVRNYNHDPYGTYNPRGGYYASSAIAFGSFVSDPEGVLPPKEVVIGSRTETGAFAVHKEVIATHGVIEIDMDEMQYVMVYDDDLDTAYVYENPEGAIIEEFDEGYRYNGEIYPADGLPLEPEVRFDAMWFAWLGYYPSTVLLH